MKIIGIVNQIPEIKEAVEGLGSLRKSLDEIKENHTKILTDFFDDNKDKRTQCWKVLEDYFNDKGLADREKFGLKLSEDLSTVSCYELIERKSPEQLVAMLKEKILGA